MRQLICAIRQALFDLLDRRTVLTLAILLSIGIGRVLWNMTLLSTPLIATQALQNATLYDRTIRDARTPYSDEVIDLVEGLNELTVTHDYMMKESAIPVPVTYLIELGQRVSQSRPRMSVRLYSDYPFPWRQEDGRPRDKFEADALDDLRTYPERAFFRIDRYDKHKAFRYARADLMEASCVACHNTHPESPKTDWKIGDIRGVLESTQLLDDITAQTHIKLQETFIVLSGLSVMGLSGLTLTMSRLRQNSKELERRVVERTAQLQQANEELEIDREKSERLLLNILPQSSAEDLKQGSSHIAREFASVTILFADILGFTTLSAQVYLEQLVTRLNGILSDFDSLYEKHDLEKIKTIGDANMVAGGIPQERPDSARAVAEMELDMQQVLVSFNRLNRTNLKIRIGMNTGLVVAGVIGTKKFIDDFWGDAVNTASWMESHGIANKIQVTEASGRELKHQYIFEERGCLKVQEKGKMMI